jgi:hypothetical protein
MDSDAEKYISDLEKKILLPKGFCESLISEDDWSFVIKTHALFEAALSQLLAHHLGKPELLDVLTRLETSNTSTGKLAIAKSLGYLEDEERRLIRSWSELRNALVHDVTNTSFNFKAHIMLMSADNQKKYLRNFYMEEWYQPNIETDKGFAEAIDNPKDFLYRGALSLLYQLSNYFEWVDWDKEVEHQKWLKKKFLDYRNNSDEPAI